MTLGLYAKKIGMTREFYDAGIVVPVTVLQIEKGRVIDIIHKEKRGYNAVKIGFGNIKNSKLTKQMKGFYSKKSTEPKKVLKEFRVKNINEIKEGNEIGLEILKDKKFVDVTGKTIGKGFAGVMKRHNFSGLRATHGVSVSHRSHGSTGQRQDPGRVFKGKKMAGHMGNKSRTIQNLEIIKSDVERGLIYIKGSVPGSKNGFLLIQESKKNISKKTILDKVSTLTKEKTIPKKDKKASAKSEAQSNTPKKENVKKQDDKKEAKNK